LRATQKPAKDDCVLFAFKKNKLGFWKLSPCLMNDSGEIKNNFFEVVYTLRSRVIAALNAGGSI
jgi:hypothetical protein